MKIKRISLSADEYYGHFSGRDFEFDTENLVVVHGPNESGKSTFLNLVRDLLFGIKRNAQYAFNDASQKMQVRALLELGGDKTGNSPRTLEIIRRKGNRNVLTGQFENGETVDEARFKKLLNLPDRDEYENVFGFTQAILNADLQADKNGPLAQTLYSTAFRAGGVAELKKRLKEESDAYFTPQARTRKLNETIGQIENLLGDFERARVDRGEYVELETRLESLAKEIEQLEKSLAVKERDKRHFEKLQKSRSHYLALKRNRARLTQIDASHPKAVGFPANGETDYRNLAATIAEIGDSIDANAESVAKTRLQIDLHTRQCHEDVLKIAVPLHRLANRKSGYDSLVRQLPERKDSLESTNQNIETLLKRLAPDAKLETVIDRTVTDSTLAELESLQQRARNVLQEITEQNVRLSMLQSQLVEQENTQNRLVAELQTDVIGEDDRRRIELLISELTHYEIACDKLHELETVQNALREEIDAALTRLSQRLAGDGIASQELSLFRQFPDEDAIRKFDDELDALRQNLDGQENRLAECTEKLAKCELEIAKLDAGGGMPPTIEEIRKERENRDRVWRHFRRRYLEPGKQDENASDASNEQPMPDSYERLVQAADAAADLRFDRVNDVRRLEELLKERESHTQRIEALQAERQTAQKRWDDATTEWLSMWPGCRPELVKRPTAMYEARREWDKREQARQRLRDIATDMERPQSQKTSYERQATGLTEKFPNLGTFGRTLPNGETMWELPEIKALCRSLKDAVDRHADRQRQTAQCRESIVTTQSDMEAVRNAVALANDQLAEIGRRAQRLAAEIGLFDGGFYGQNVDESIGMTLNGCELIRQIRLEHAKCLREQKRLQEIESQARQFENDAATTLQAVAWEADAAAFAPVELLEYALTILERSEKAKREIDTLETQLAMLGQADQTEREKLATLQTRRQTLLETTGVANEEAFLRLAAVAAERKRCVDLITESERPLLAILETTDLPSWESELEKRFGDDQADASSDPQLDSLLEKIGAEAGLLREKLDRLREEKGGTDRDLAKLRQSGGAAEIAEQVEFARQELLDNVNFFVPRLLALRTLEYAIEKFEREQQPETLQEIRRYFSAMTGGRYAWVGTRIGGDGSLAIFENNGREKTVDQLSTGTREQLHLAVRLAYIAHFCKSREPLPIVLDDVLVNFDPPRQIETLRFLGELSKRMQIIFLTCHDATVDMARDTVPTSQLIAL